MNQADFASMSPLFIHRPALQPRRGKLAFHVLTVVAWAVYLYLWLPLVTLLLWWAAGKLGLRELGRYPEFVDFELFLVVAKAFLIAVALLLGWAEYNRRRFQGVERRQRTPDQALLDTAEAMGASHPLATQLLGARRTIVVMDEEAVPIGLRETLPVDGLVAAA